MGRIPNSQHASLQAKIKAPATTILTLSFEFPNNYSQKRVLWRNMPPPNRHGSPLKKMIVIKKSLAARVRAKRSSVKFSRVSTKTEGTPRSLCHQSVILGGKSTPFCLCFSSPTPRVSLISTPTRPRLSASQTLPCAPRRRRAGKKGVGTRQFHQHLTVAPRKHRVCARSCCREGKTDGLRGQWQRTWRRGHGEGKNPHGCADKAAGEGEREGQGWRVTRYFCNAQLPHTPAQFRLCRVAISRVATSECLAVQFKA